MRSILEDVLLCPSLIVAGLNSVQASSLDFAKAKTFAEGNICASAPLQRVDEDLNAEYVKTLEQSMRVQGSLSSPPGFAVIDSSLTLTTISQAEQRLAIKLVCLCAGRGFERISDEEMG
ncbi:hypothetical protein ACV356_32495, partial [Pseudomonas aeruginosa]